MKGKIFLAFPILLLFLVIMMTEIWADGEQGLVFTGECGYGDPYTYSKYDKLRIYEYESPYWGDEIAVCSFSQSAPHTYYKIVGVDEDPQYFGYKTFDSEGEEVCSSIKYWDGSTNPLWHAVHITGNCPGQ